MGDPLRGADRVNDELEVGYDERFEARWTIAQKVGLLVMLSFVLCCLSGLLGRGPYSHRVVTAPDKSLRVDFEPVARELTPTQVTLHVSNDEPLAIPIGLYVSGMIAEPLGLDHSLPVASRSLVGGDGMVLGFVLAPHQHDALIRLAAMPGRAGWAHLRAWRGDAPDADTRTIDPPDKQHIVAWSQLVLP